MLKRLLTLSAMVALALTSVGDAPAAFGADLSARYQRALQYELAGNIDAAKAEYAAMIKEDPASIEARLRLGSALLNYDGDVDGAISQFVTALGIDPQCKACQSELDSAVERRNMTAAEALARGNDFYRMGQLARSVGMYKLAIYLDPKNAEAWNSVSWSLYRLGSLQEALTAVREALRLKTDEPEFINTLACILHDQGDLDGAMAQWQKAIQRSKKANPADLYGLAIGFLAKGDTQRAIENYKEAIKSDPNYSDVKYLRDRIGMSVQALASHDKLVSLVGEPEKDDSKR